MTAASTTPPDPAQETAGDPPAPDPAPGAGESGTGTPGNGTPGPGASGPGASAPGPSSENRFLLWLRSLDLARRPGWVGGVCSGIADRLGIDPLIVRGIFVVVAVLGGPAFLFYAAAWLLLPDEDGVLPVEELLRGRLTRVHAGIGALVLASMLPVAQGFWSLGGAYTGAVPWAPATGRALWTVVVLVLIVLFVVWIARRSGRIDPAPPHFGSPEGPGASTAGYPAPTGEPASGAPLLPPQRPTEPRPSTPEDLALWRERQEEWKAEREAFRAQESATARETARARAEESRLRAAAITAARLERRRLHREANPRLRRSVTLLVLGLAAVAGAIASLTVSGSTATVVGFSVATLVLGLAIVAAGLLRRRAILLIAVSVITVLTASTASLVPPERQLLPLLSSYGVSNATPGSYAMLAGDLQITIDPSLGAPGEVIDVWQGAGNITVVPMAGAAVRLEASTANGYYWLTTAFADGDVGSEPENVEYSRDGATWTQTFGDPDAEPVVVRIAQGRGGVTVYDRTAEDSTSGAALDPNGTATAEPTSEATAAADLPTPTDTGTTTDPTTSTDPGSTPGTDSTTPTEAGR
ncbi:MULTISPECIES: PspC domain-containing protein [unclassified Rathayibacter]|uniref:PspC domain-containing protein n=1 Tax=unclassified Rathayibacter TaxID=2609250 RepID=UPI000F4C9EBE|nr:MULTISPECIES: PspC domain-containing protein [unclassified Rathayibacter]ROP49580.1 phage shock protein C (PspC) family protein [Rathayibacter sp. PhB186]ROS51926.1 phage shock protein C (PspC) family protein [Rathayibacter sp. PhB185]